MKKPVKVIIQLYPTLPTKDDAERIARPIGRDTDLYHEVVHGMTDIVKAADDLGYWAISTIEHHFHSEGYEVGPVPGPLNAYWAALTKRIRVGTLGYVMATQDPVRVAEETAIIDHLLKGRYFVGFARGYQSRWANVLGQKYGAVATVSDKSTADLLNRKVFEEKVNMVLKCWQQEAVEFKGDTYEVPYPFETGVTDYPAADLAKLMGAHGEVDESGAIRKVSVVPAPYQKPHPPILVAASSSPETGTYCGSRGFVPAYFSPLKTCMATAQAYQDAAIAAGRNVEFGEGQCLVRWPHVNNSYEEYKQALAKYDESIYWNFYAKFFKGFMPPPDFDNLDTRMQMIADGGLFYGGTVDQVVDQIGREREQLPTEYLCFIWHYAQQPKEDVIREMELLATKVLPQLGISMDASQPASV